MRPISNETGTERRSVSAELEIKMQRMSSRSSEPDATGGRAVQIARSESPARIGDTFRSGWSRSVQVQPPLSAEAPRLRHLSFGDAVAAAIAGRNSSRCPLATHELGAAELPRGFSHADNDSNSSHRTRSESASTAATGVFVPECHGSGPWHEGWLSKRTSARFTARWQRRYFTLEGCVLRYHQQPGGPAKRSFDIRRAKRICAVSGQAREMELDFGFRVWRLRADSAEAARRWLLLLDTGRLLAGMPEEAVTEECMGQWSDDETGSSSTTDSLPSGELPREPTTPNFATRFATPTVLSSVPCNTVFPSVASSMKMGSHYLPPKSVAPPPPSIAERLEVDPQLDKKFEAWLPSAVASGGPVSGERLLRGLGEALNGLWAALGEGASSRERALATLLRHPQPDPVDMGGAIEAVLTEYLTRIRQSLVRWIEEGDPEADEVANMARWFINDARPELRLFEAGLHTAAQHELKHCRDVADSTERLLLRELESRRCDEVARRCEAVYSSNEPIADNAEKASPWRCRPAASVEILREVADQATAWHNHSDAFDRATSVLIAALNALLRSFRHAAWPRRRSNYRLGSTGTKESLRKVLRKLGERALSRSQSGLAEAGPSLQDLVQAATEAAFVATFCAQAGIQAMTVTSFSDPATAALRSELLAAFSLAFKRECSALCTMLAAAHFEGLVRDLRSISFRGLRPGQGTLGPSCEAATLFLQQTTEDVPGMCRGLIAEAVLQIIVKRWVQKIQHGPRSLVQPGLAAALEVDEELLSQMASRWGCEDSLLHGPLRSAMSEGIGHLSTEEDTDTFRCWP